MKVEKLVKIIGSDFYIGGPDSQVKALCNKREMPHENNDELRENSPFPYNA